MTNKEKNYWKNHDVSPVVMGEVKRKTNPIIEEIGEMKIATFGLKEKLKDFPDVMVALEKALQTQKETLIREFGKEIKVFIKDQRYRKYSADLIIKHMIDYFRF